MAKARSAGGKSKKSSLDKKQTKGTTRKAGPRKAAPRAAKGEAPAKKHDPARENALAAAQAALDKKALNVVLLDVKGLSDYAEYVLVMTGESEPQVAAIADAIEDAMKKRGSRPIGTEGAQSGKWVLIDFGDVVAHVFYQDTREFYDIEGLWADAPREVVNG